MKIMLVLLVAVVAAFVVLTICGTSTNNSHPGTTADNFQIGDYPFVNALSSAIGSFSPKLTVSQLQPASGTFNLAAQSSYQAVALADASTQFRSAKFSMNAANNQPCALVTYTAASPPTGALSSLAIQPPKAQAAKYKISSSGNSAEESVVVLSSGGNLVVSRSSTYSGLPCTVTLE